VFNFFFVVGGRVWPPLPAYTGLRIFTQITKAGHGVFYYLDSGD